MAKKIEAEMSTKIALDLVGATKSVSGLTSAVKSAQSAWKSQEAMLKSTGEYAKAAQARYDGLGKSIENQEKKITLLKQRQSELQGNTKDTAAAYLKYQKDIDNATKQLASMQTQQERAKSSMQYQESGLAKLQQGYKQMNAVSKSYVERLQAEGKTQEANQAKVNGYKSSITSLSKQLELQEKELERVGNATGKTSAEYLTQKTRVNETATSLAKAKNNMNDLNDEMKRANPSPFARIKSALTGVNKEGEKSQSVFKSVFSANILSNVASSAWSHLSGWISSATSSAKEYSLAQQTMNATWTTLTGNASKGKAMVDMTNQMAIAANNATDMVDGMNQKFYSISKNADTTKSLTKSVLTLQDAFGQSDDAVMNFSTQFAQMMANGKVGAQDMMSFVNVFPVLRTNLLKTEQQLTGNHKMTMAQMNDLMSAGKISSATMEKVLQNTAKQYGAATENFGKTIPGMIRTVKSQMPVLLSAITTPLTTAANPVIGTISGWVSSSKTKAMFTQVGKTFAKGLNSTIKAFSAGGGNSASTLTDKLNAGVEKLNSFISKTFAYLSSHAKDIKGVATDTWEIVKALASGVWTAFTSVLSTIGGLLGVTGKNGKSAAGPLKTLHSILNWMVEHKTAVKAFGEVLAGLWMTSKVLRFASAIGKVTGAISKLAKSKTVSSLFTTGKTGVSNLLSGASAGGAFQSLKSAGGVAGLSTVGKVATGASAIGIGLDSGTSIVKAFTDKGASAKFKDAGKGIGSLIGGGIGLFFGGPLGAMLGSQIGKVLGGWGGQGAKKFTDGWNAKKKPASGWLQGLGFDAHKVLQPVINVASSMAKSVGKAVSNFLAPVVKGAKSMAKQVKPIISQVGKLFSALWKLISAGAKAAWKIIGPILSKLAKTMSKTFKSISKVVKPLWSGLWKVVGTVLKTAWKLITKTISGALKTVTNVLKVATDLLSGNWSKAWRDIRKTVSGAWSSIKSIAKTGINGVLSIVRTVGSSIHKAWSAIWNGFKKTVSGIWGGIKSAVRGGINGVIGIINGMIGGVNAVWQKFTGHNAIGKIQKLASGGFVGKMHMAMVNDGPGKDWKELYQLPSGQFGMMPQRNAVTMLPEGTRVYNGKETRNIMGMAGITKYAKGGVVGFLGSLWNGAKDKFEQVTDWLKHPLKNLVKVIANSISGLSSTTSTFTSLGTGFVHKITGSISDWMSAKLKALKKSLTPKEPSGSGVKRWKPLVIKALEANHLSTSAGMVAKVLRQIATESGGNAKAVQGNIGDINNITGDLAKGLMQTISTTFNANAFPGHKDIFNGYDNLLAALHYAKGRYGSNLSGLGEGHGYANGGLVSGAAYRLTGEAGPEMIMPLSQAKASRAWQLLGSAVERINQNQNTGNVIGTEANGQDLGAKLDTIAGLLTNLAFAITVDLDGDAVAQKQAPKVKAIIDNSNRFNTYWKN